MPPEAEGPRQATNPPVGPWGVPDGVDCPRCHNTGLLCRKDELGRVYGRDCTCMAARRSNRLLERSGLRGMLERCTFQSFETPEPWQAAAKAAAERYAEGKQGWFLAAGSVGAGKTHLCTAICGELLAAGIETRYVLWRDFSAQAKSSLAEGNGTAYTELLQPLKKVPLLYIDDLFKSGREWDRAKGQWRRMTPTQGDVSLAFELLNTRYCDAGKLTVISTELGLGALLDIDEALGSRICERCGHNMVLFQDRSNWRLREG